MVAYDPRGIGRSERTDAAKESAAEQHADDVHRLISALDTGSVDIFGSSGGTVTGLVLVAGHPEQVRTLVAHEPPAVVVAERLGTDPVIFPSHHGGFLCGEFDWRGEPDTFAATLRDVLDGR